MSHDRWTRRAGALCTCVALLLAAGGCRRSPFQRPNEPLPDFERPSDSTPAPQPVPLVQAAPSTAADPAPAVRAPITFAATPMLDAALKRAEAVEQAQREAAVPAVSHSPVPIAKLELISAVKSAEGPAKPHSKAENGTTELESGSKLDEAQIEPDEETTEPVDPATEWGQSIERLKQLTRDSATSPDQEDVWKARARVIDLLSGDPSSPSQRAALEDAVTALADVTSHSGPDGPARSAALRSAAMALEDRAPLEIGEFRLCRNVLGFGAFEPLESDRLKSGDSVLIYCEMKGVRYSSKDTSFVSRLTSRVELVSGPQGKAVWEHALGEAEDVCRSRRRDYYLNYRIAIPATIPSGEYRLRLTQTDLIARQSTFSEIPLTLAP